MDEAIGAAATAEAKAAQLEAEVARLQQELALWKGPVTVPTTEDCWRLFRTQDDIECWCRAPAHRPEMCSYRSA